MSSGGRGAAGHGSGSRGRRPKKHEEEEHENHERWLVSYADMVTLLMVLFIVLFAMSQVDKAKFAALASGLSESFGAPITALPGVANESSVLDGLPAPADIALGMGAEASASREQVDLAAAQAALSDAQRVAAEARGVYDELAEARAALAAALAAAGYPDAARFEIDERGLVVHVVADQVLFDAERAELRPAGGRVLDAIAPTLRDLPQPLRIEGHANSLPVTRGGPWPSNWELSGIRAATVLRYLTTSGGLTDDRVSFAGYGDTRPLVPDSDPDFVTVNRRVDIVVLSTASAAANQLLPGLDAAAQAAPVAVPVPAVPPAAAPAATSEESQP